MIIAKINTNFTPLLTAVIIDHSQTCNFILLGCFNQPFMSMATDYGHPMKAKMKET